MRPAARSSFGRPADPPLAAFQSIQLGRRVVYLHRDLATSASTIVPSLNSLRTGRGAGNRLSGFPLTLADGTKLFVRMNHRGGLIRWAVRDIYIGIRARPLRELAVAEEALRRGIPIAEPMGAVVEWVAPIAYRGLFITRALAGMTLWKFLRTDDDPFVRSYLIEQTRQALDIMHRRGLFHADLNLHNLFVAQSGESFTVAILDLDKARLFPGPLPAGMRQRNLARLRDSVHKLDPDRRYLDSHGLELLTRG